MTGSALILHLVGLICPVHLDFDCFVNSLLFITRLLVFGFSALFLVESGRNQRPSIGTFLGFRAVGRCTSFEIIDRSILTRQKLLIDFEPILKYFLAFLQVLPHLIALRLVYVILRIYPVIPLYLRQLLGPFLLYLLVGSETLRRWLEVSAAFGRQPHMSIARVRHHLDSFIDRRLVIPRLRVQRVPRNDIVSFVWLLLNILRRTLLQFPVNCQQVDFGTVLKILIQSLQNSCTLQRLYLDIGRQSLVFVTLEVPKDQIGITVLGL